MSWFKRRPKIRDPIKTVPQKTSPVAEKLLKEFKKKVQEKDENTK